MNPQPAVQLPGQDPALLGYLLLAGLSLFWGLAWPIMKVALNEIRPWTFRAVSLALGAAGLMALAKSRGFRFTVTKSEWMPLVLVSLLNVTGWHLCSAHGIARMQAGRSVIIGYTMALWATLLARFVLGEKLSGWRILALIAGLGGLGTLILPDFKNVGAAPLGAAFMLAAAMSWGAGTVLVKYFKLTMPVMVLTGWQLALGSVPVIAGAFLLEDVSILAQVSWKAWLAMLYVVLLPMIFCHWAWFSVVSLFPASVAAIGTLAIPVIGVLSSTLMLGETLGFQEISALSIVVVSVGIVLLSRPASSPKSAVKELA